MIDDNLLWSAHVQFISKRLSRVIFLLRRIMTCVPETYLKSLCCAFFHSIIRYGLVIWSNSSKINDILFLQKKAIRFITKSQHLDHCQPLFIQLKLQTIINLYIFDLVSYVLKNSESQIFVGDCHNYNTRNKSNILIDYCRLSKTQHSHIIVS